MKKEEAEQLVKSYLGKSARTIEVQPFGDMLSVSIVYSDGKPMWEVRSWLNEHIENLWHETIERVFSEETIKEALFDIYNEDDDLAIRVEQYLLRKEIAPTHPGQALSQSK